MARIGSFDATIRPIAWFDDSALSDGWFDADLISEDTPGGNSQSVVFTLDDTVVGVAQGAQHPQSIAFTLADVAVAANQSVSPGESNTQAVAFTLDDVSVYAIQRSPEAATTIGATGGSMARLRKQQDEELIEIIMTLIAEEVI